MGGFAGTIPTTLNFKGDMWILNDYFNVMILEYDGENLIYF